MIAGNLRPPAAGSGRYRSAASVGPSGMGMRVLRTFRTGNGADTLSSSASARRDHRQDDVRRPVAAEVDRVDGGDRVGVAAHRLARVGVDVEPGEVAAGDVDADAV